MTTTEPIEPVEPVEPEPFVLPDDFGATVQSWEVPIEALPEAVAQYKALQTEEGVIDAFIATGQSLGFGIKELEKLFADDPVAAVAAVAAEAAVAPVAAEHEDPDRLMTAKEVQDLLAEQRTAFEGQFTQREQAEFQSRQAKTFSAIDNWFTQNDVTDPDTQRIIAQFGEKHIVPGADSYDPQVAIQALEKGQADYDAFVERQAQEVVARKAKIKEAQPVVLGGGGATNTGEGADDGPDYRKLGSGALDAAKQRVRDRLRQSGELA